MTKPFVGRPLGSGLAALVLLAVAFRCTNSGGSWSSAPSPAHTEPSDPAALFVSPPDNLHATLAPQGLSELPSFGGPVVDENGKKKALTSVHGWSVAWSAGGGQIITEVDDMVSADDAQRRVNVTGAATEPIRPENKRTRFDVSGVGGAVGIYIDAPPGRLNFATVLASSVIYFTAVGVITDGEEGRAIVIQMAQAQADHLRAIG
jgi:hypothetical protein